MIPTNNNNFLTKHSFILGFLFLSIHMIGLFTISIFKIKPVNYSRVVNTLAFEAPVLLRVLAYSLFSLYIIQKHEKLQCPLALLNTIIVIFTTHKYIEHFKQNNSITYIISMSSLLIFNFIILLHILKTIVN